jgi:hypothetical protein
MHQHCINCTHAGLWHTDKSRHGLLTADCLFNPMDDDLAKGWPGMRLRIFPETGTRCRLFKRKTES